MVAITSVAACGLPATHGFVFPSLCMAPADKSRYSHTIISASSPQIKTVMPRTSSCKKLGQLRICRLHIGHQSINPSATRSVARGCTPRQHLIFAPWNEKTSASTHLPHEKTRPNCSGRVARPHRRPVAIVRRDQHAHAAPAAVTPAVFARLSAPLCDWACLITATATCLIHRYQGFIKVVLPVRN